MTRQVFRNEFRAARMGRPAHLYAAAALAAREELAPTLGAAHYNRTPRALRFAPGPTLRRNEKNAAAGFSPLPTIRE